MTGLPPQGPRFDSLPRLAYVNALFIIGTIGTLITPAMLDGWAQLNWSATRLGAVAAIELAGLALGSYVLVGHIGDRTITEKVSKFQ